MTGFYPSVKGYSVTNCQISLSALSLAEYTSRTAVLLQFFEWQVGSRWAALIYYSEDVLLEREFIKIPSRKCLLSYSRARPSPWESVEGGARPTSPEGLWNTMLGTAEACWNRYTWPETVVLFSVTSSLKHIIMLTHDRISSTWCI